MNWKNYSSLRNSHAFLSASRYHWLRYDDEKLLNVYTNWQKTQLGTKYHKLAADLIELGVPLRESISSFNNFVNDAIGFRMSPEVTLYYSDNAYGTADAISFRDNVLRIHDLKTGTTTASIDQVLIYAAYFYLDYKLRPDAIFLRIYQNDEILEYEPSFEEIQEVADRIIAFDKLIEHMKQEALIAIF